MHNELTDDEMVGRLLADLEAVENLPDGKEKIGKGHIICHRHWHKAHLQDPDLSFREAASRYCNVKPNKAFITLWNGIEAVTFSNNSVMTPEEQELVASNLNKWFAAKGIKAVSIGTV